VIHNIGTGGLMAEFPVELVRGRAVELTLITRAGSLTLEGRVAWTAAGEGHVRPGVAFG
jgi:hypothetical protein